MFLLLMVFVATMTPGLAQLSSQCCPVGQAVLRRLRPFACWEPISNSTVPISLACNELEIITQRQMDFYVNGAGHLVFLLPNREIEHEPGTFCVANTTTRNDKNFSKTVLATLLCIEAEKTVGDEVLGYCMVVSTVLLIFTAVIYIALPEIQDLQGKSIINFCLSLGTGLGILAAMRLVSYSDMGLCAARGFLAYFFIMASFFWMNAISIQILFSLSRPTISIHGWREFSYHAMYAWGCSATLTIIMAIVNFTPGDHYKPGIGLNHCWFFDKKQQWYYMFSVMSILIAANILIFLYISIHLWRSSFSSSHVKALRYKFMMTFRMAVVMGVSWIFEMIGSLTKSHILWELLDVLNCLQGVLIFLVLVVFRKRVIKCVYNRGWLDCVSGPVEKCLALEEDEEGVEEHTMGVTLDDTPRITT